MKSSRYIFIIICIALATFAQAQSKVGHFDQTFILKKMAGSRQRLTSWKSSLLVKYNNAWEAPAILTAADSANTDSLLFRIIKDWNYQYVFNPDYLLAAPANGNLTPLVAREMQIKMPDSNACDVTTVARFAYCNRDSVLTQIPEARAADSLLAIFQNDSLSMEYDSLLAEFQRYDSCLRIDHGCFNTRQPNRNNIKSCFEKLQNWVNYSAGRVQEKKFVLLKPYYDKIEKAIKMLAEKEGYDYIFKDDFHFVGVENILGEVVKELQLFSM